MIETLQHFENVGLVSADELAEAEAGQAAGSAKHTIGYELELLPSAGKETPRVTECKETGLDPLDVAEHELYWTNYGVGPDGVYELQSPPATHPLPLTIATRGLVKAGWLPENPKGVVTAHVSIGTDKEIDFGSELHHSLIPLLRAVELAGGTTPGRLMAPVNMAVKGSDRLPSTGYSWNRKGVAGVERGSFDELNRIEFRTLRYKSTEEFKTTLDNIYFLSRGLLSDPSSKAGMIYSDFADWFINYRCAAGLPAEDFNFNVMRYDHPIKETKEYIGPYAKYLGRSTVKRAGSNIVKIKVGQAVTELTKVFDMAYSRYAKSGSAC